MVLSDRSHRNTYVSSYRIANLPLFSFPQAQEPLPPQGPGQVPRFQVQVKVQIGPHPTSTQIDPIHSLSVALVRERAIETREGERAAKYGQGGGSQVDGSESSQV